MTDGLWAALSGYFDGDVAPEDLDALLPAARPPALRLTEERVFALRHLPVYEAAEQLGVSRTRLKTWYRQFGKWPHCQLKSLRRALDECPPNMTDVRDRLARAAADSSQAVPKDVYGLVKQVRQRRSRAHSTKY
jgi:hypothetical protein